MLTGTNSSGLFTHQVKKNLVNVSYHIAQYTNIISDLRCEIQRLKKKIADQSSRQLSSERADIRHVQGEVLPEGALQELRESSCKAKRCLTCALGCCSFQRRSRPTPASRREQRRIS